MNKKDMPRLQKMYREEIREQMQERFSYINPMQIPGLTKVVLNMGLGKEAMDNANNVTNAQAQMELISGQKCVVAKAKNSIAGFRLREEMPIGVFTTLRGDRMWEFLDRLINFSLPRVRDFRGLSPKSFDGRGNYNFGIDEQAIFPEIDVDKIDRFRGMNITIVTTAKTDEEGYELMKFFGMPYRRSGRGGM